MADFRKTANALCKTSLGVAAAVILAFSPARAQLVGGSTMEQLEVTGLADYAKPLNEKNMDECFRTLAEQPPKPFLRSGYLSFEARLNGTSCIRSVFVGTNETEANTDRTDICTYSMIKGNEGQYDRRPALSVYRKNMAPDSLPVAQLWNPMGRSLSTRRTVYDILQMPNNNLNGAPNTAVIYLSRDEETLKAISAKVRFVAIRNGVPVASDIPIADLQLTKEAERYKGMFPHLDALCFPNRSARLRNGHTHG